MVLTVHVAEDLVQQGDALPPDLEACWQKACPNDESWEDLTIETAEAFRGVLPDELLQSVILRAAGDIEVVAAPKRVIEALGAGLLQRLEHPLYPQETLGMGSR